MGSWDGDSLFTNILLLETIHICVNPLSANFTKWTNTLKQFVGKFPTNCLSVFDHFVGLELKGLIAFFKMSTLLKFFAKILTIILLDDKGIPLSVQRNFDGKAMGRPLETTLVKTLLELYENNWQKNYRIELKTVYMRVFLKQVEWVLQLGNHPLTFCKPSQPAQDIFKTS